MISADHEHHREGQQVLDVADGEREPRRHEEEIERRDADERGEHRGAAPESQRHQHDGEQEQHHDVGEVEVRLCSGSATSVVATQREPAAQRSAAACAPCARIGVLIACRRSVAPARMRRRAPTSIRSTSGASSPTRRAVRCAHGHATRAGRAARRRSSSSCACARTRRSPPPRSPPARIAVVAPRSCASLTVSQDALALALPAAAAAPASRRRPPSTRRRAACASRAALRTTSSPPAPGPMQHSSARLGLPHALDRLVGAVRLDVVLDAVGGAAQRELAQRHQVALAEEVARRALGLLGQVDLARLQPREQVVGGDVDQHDLVGLVEEGVGHRLPDADAGDAADDVVQALEVLDVERREDVDAGGEQLVDVLPALGMARARRRWCARARRRGSSAGCRASAASRSNSCSSLPW